MDQQNVQVEEGISLKHVFKVLVQKIKYLLLAVLIGVVLGGAFAVWRTHDVHYYGSSVEFYVNPEKEEDSTVSENSQYGVYGAYGNHVMDNMVRLLSSESFAETMMLENKFLPQKDVWTTAAEEAALGLNAKIDKAQEKIDPWQEAQNALSDLVKERNDLSLQLTKANKELNAEWNKCYTNNPELFKTTVFNSETYHTASNNIKGNDEYAALHTAYLKKTDASDKLDAADLNIEKNKPGVKELRTTAEYAIEDALIAWRQTAKYQKILMGYTSSIEYSFTQDKQSADSSNFARSFIYVDISVLNDENFAKELLERVKTVVPEYVEENMAVPASYSGTNCQRITRMDDIRLTNPDEMTSTAIKYAVLVGALALVIACVVVVLVDNADKRLRDPDVVANEFNIPVLGVIPRIKDIEETSKREGK